MMLEAIRFKNKRLWYLDQSRLPLRELWQECRSLEDGFRAIRGLKVRGAPLIGVFAAYCIVIHSKNLSRDKKKFLAQLSEAFKYLGSCRPTAVNLSWALRRLEEAARGNRQKSTSSIKAALLKEACLIHAEDRDSSRRMAGYGARLIKSGDRILTHCNTGFLAASGEGTALAVIYGAKRRRKNITVYADETRPLLQGARLTAWELSKKKIPFFIICDSAAAYLMQKKCVDKIFVGADRIAANGDVANKIGTYSLSICAAHHKIPFYVVAPSSTFDVSLSKGSDIRIEQRNADEVCSILGEVRVAPKKARAKNFAFDVTPHHLITALICDKGLIYPPFKKNIRKVLCGRRN
jgi:methylthioribose-1-phosphate isomerase